jgi:ATP-dependent exoDNAse (exonuclease V) alpha subunit
MDNSEPLPRLYVFEFRLGYCCTVHSAQGSEWNNVCYIMDTKLDHPLIYTACSRAAKKIRIIDLLS